MCEEVVTLKMCEEVATLKMCEEVASPKIDLSWKSRNTCEKGNRYLKKKNKNDKRYNNRDYSLFFLIDIFFERLWLIPNILKWTELQHFY